MSSSEIRVDTIKSRTGLGTVTINSSGLQFSGIITSENRVDVKSYDGTPGRLDLYCESSNAHYARIQAPDHADFSGNVTLTLPNTAGTLLNSDVSGNVGIGTTNPAESLNIFASSGNDAAIQLQTTTIDVNKARISKENTGELKIASSLGSSGRAIVFETKGSDQKERMRITSSGEVGIGTDNPIASLHVEKDGISQVLARFESNMGTNNSRGISIKSPVSDSASEPFIFDTGNAYEFQCDSTSALHINFDRNIGIGESSPQARLHGVVDITWDSTDYAFIFENQETQNLYGNTVRIIGGGGAGAGHETSNILAVGDNDGNVDFLVRGDGNVGVGTSVPTEKLHVLGDARITGDLILPTQERFIAYKTGDQSIADVGEAAVTFSAATYDTASGWDSSNNRYTVQNSGFFLLITNVAVASANANELRDAAISIERSTDSGSNWTPIASSGMRANTTADTDGLTFHIVLPYNLNAGDYLRVGAYGNTGDGGNWIVEDSINDIMGGDITLTGAAADYDNTSTYFSAVKMG